MSGGRQTDPAAALACSGIGLPGSALEASAFRGVRFSVRLRCCCVGLQAQQGKVPLWLVFAFGSVGSVGSVGSIVGDSIAYEVGRRYGDRLLQRLPPWLVKP